MCLFNNRMFLVSFILQEMNCSNSTAEEDGGSISHTEKEASNLDPYDQGKTFGPNLATDAISHRGEQSSSRHLSDHESKAKSTKRHQKAVHPGTMIFNCDHCRHKTNRKASLVKHMRIHTRFACDLCDYKTKSKSNLHHHVLLLHKTNEEASHTAFACHICNYKARSKYKLDHHVLNHSGEHVILCDDCNFRTKYKSSLAQHMLIHTGKLPFSCDLCEYKARRKSALKKHMSTHSEK